MTDAGSPEAVTLFGDSEGALPKPWVAFRKPDPPDKGALYYHNLNTSQTQWERPNVHIAQHRICFEHKFPMFGGWKDLDWHELPASTAAEASEIFREFCVRLFPRGSFGRRGDGMLWRLDEAECAGVVFCPARRRLAVCYDPEVVTTADLMAMADAFTSAPLTMAAKLAALDFVLQSLATRATAAATLTAAAPGGCLLRRYTAELGGNHVGVIHPDMSAKAPRVEALTSYLKGFSLLRPLTCSLSSSSFPDEAQLATHLTSEQHLQRRLHLRSAEERLAEVRRGEVPLTDWLPAHLGRYRSCLQWCDRRFQDMPMADGRVMRFDHLTGLGTVTPASNWAALAQPPEALMPQASCVNGARAGQEMPGGQGYGQGQIWADPRSSAGVAPSRLGSVEELLAAVRHSLGVMDVNLAAQPGPENACEEEDLVAELEPPWMVLHNTSGCRYYYNPETHITTWDHPMLPEVGVGESWASSPGSLARETPAELYQRFHRMVPRPQRGPP